jgi:hypothetical protein
MARVIREFESHRFRQFFAETNEPTVWLVGEIRRVWLASQTAARRMWADLTASANFTQARGRFLYARFRTLALLALVMRYSLRLISSPYWNSCQ